MGSVDWFRRHGIGYAHHAANQGDTDLPADEKSTSSPPLFWHTELESTVRYLSIEVNDALEMAEQTET